MDDGLVHVLVVLVIQCLVCLNPCCSGRWSRTDSYGISTDVICVVLILVVVEDGLVPYYKHFNHLNYGRLNPCCSGRWSRTLDAWDEKRLTRQS